jgi:hypothetical protein
MLGLFGVRKLSLVWLGKEEIMGSFEITAAAEGS